MAVSNWTQFSEEQKDQLLGTLEGFYNDPEVGPQVQELIEKKFGVTDPQLAAARRNSKEVDSLREQVASLEAKQTQKEIVSRIEGAKKAAQEKYSLSDDDMKEVSKIMIEGGIGDYEKGADYFRMQRQLATPTSDAIVEHSAMSLPGDEGLFKDPRGWARKEAYKALNDIERNRPR